MSVDRLSCLGHRPCSRCPKYPSSCNLIASDKSNRSVWRCCGRTLHNISIGRLRSSKLVSWRVGKACPREWNDLLINDTYGVRTEHPCDSALRLFRRKHRPGSLMVCVWVLYWSLGIHSIAYCSSWKGIIPWICNVAAWTCREVDRITISDAINLPSNPITGLPTFPTLPFNAVFHVRASRLLQGYAGLYYSLVCRCILFPSGLQPC